MTSTTSENRERGSRLADARYRVEQIMLLFQVGMLADVRADQRLGTLNLSIEIGDVFLDRDSDHCDHAPGFETILFGDSHLDERFQAPHK